MTREITRELRQLAKFTPGPFPVLSVYLNTQRRDQHQREQLSTFLTHHMRQAQSLVVDAGAARQSLEGDLARIATWGQQVLRGRSEVNAPGLTVWWM